MKIAAVTENGTTLSQHFGRAPLYVVLTVKDGEIISKETRAKAGHSTFAAHHAEAAHGERHGFDAASQARHASMAAAIADCEVLIVGGMGLGAYQNLKGCGIETIVTDVKNIEQAVKLYLEGKLPSLLERLH